MRRWLPGLLWGIYYLVRLNGPIYFVQAVIDGLRAGLCVRSDRPGLHDGLWHRALDQLCARRRLHGGRVCQLLCHYPYNWGFVPAILFAMVICMLLNVVIERVAYKPLRNAPRIAALITAIGVSFFLESFTALRFVFSADFITYKRPFEVVVWKVWGVLITNITVIIVGVTLVLVLVLQYIIHRTKIGKAMRATSLDKPAARLMGINVDGDHLASPLPRRRPGRRGRRALCHRLPADLDLYGHHARPQGLCGRRAGRHRQYPRRLCRLAADGHGRRAGGQFLCPWARACAICSPS